MADSFQILHASYGEDDEFSSDVLDVGHKLEGWREVLLPLSSLLRWDEPYYPVIIVGLTTFLFFIMWYIEMSTLTAVSLACMLVGIFDLVVPFVGQTITGIRIWTDEEESEFMDICEMIANFQQDVTDAWRGLKALRRENTKIFFLIVFGILTVTAWLGCIVNNFFLAYLAVNCVLLIPGLRYHGITQKYSQLVMNSINGHRNSPSEKSKFS